MSNLKKIYVDDFLTEEDVENNIQPQEKIVDKEKFEEYKLKFDIKKLMSNFILKKEYFISHKTSNIHEEYDIEKKPIGQGSFGTVYRAREKDTGIARAIKQVMHQNIVNYDGFISEVSALKTLDHPNIIKLYEVFEDNKCVYLVQELCEGGELFEYIADREQLCEEDAARIFQQITSAILYCHKNWIWHRDLKLDNFMFSTKDRNSLIKLIDFGLSRSYFQYQEAGKGEVFRMETRAGTWLYMAPEVLSKDYSNSWDTWSLGVILYVMLSGLLPFEGTNDEEIEENVRSLNYNFNDHVWESVSEEAMDLISKMLIYEDERITPKEALNHPWIK